MADLDRSAEKRIPNFGLDGLDPPIGIGNSKKYSNPKYSLLPPLDRSKPHWWERSYARRMQNLDMQRSFTTNSAQFRTLW